MKNSRSDIITDCLWSAHDKETVLSLFEQSERDRLQRILEKKDMPALRSSVTKFLENTYLVNKMDHPDPKINVSFVLICIFSFFVIKLTEIWLILLGGNSNFEEESRRQEHFGVIGADELS